LGFVENGAAKDLFAPAVVTNLRAMQAAGNAAGSTP